MSNYPLRANKYNWRSLEPQNTFNSEEFTRDHYDLYLTTEHIADSHHNVRRYYRLHANQPHSIEMALAYDIRCPLCNSHIMKQVGRCLNAHDLGLYECPVCDRN